MNEREQGTLLIGPCGLKIDWKDERCDHRQEIDTDKAEANLTDFNNTLVRDEYMQHRSGYGYKA